VGHVIEAKRCEESVRREVEGVDWGVQFDNVRTRTLHLLLSPKGAYDDRPLSVYQHADWLPAPTYITVWVPLPLD